MPPSGRTSLLCPVLGVKTFFQTMKISFCSHVAISLSRIAMRAFAICRYLFTSISFRNCEQTVFWVPFCGSFFQCRNLQHRGRGIFFLEPFKYRFGHKLPIFDFMCKGSWGVLLVKLLSLPSDDCFVHFITGRFIAFRVSHPTTEHFTKVTWLFTRLPIFPIPSLDFQPARIISCCI